MKEPLNSQSRTSQSPLGYLFAFTLGIICMGAIMFFIRAQPPQPSEPQTATVVEPASQSIPPPRANVFGSRTSTRSIPRVPETIFPFTT